MFLLPYRPPRSLKPFLRHFFSLASSNQPLTIQCLFSAFAFGECILFNSFFLVSDGSSDSGPPVSPPRARKGEYPSRLHYKAHNVITDPIMWARCVTVLKYPSLSNIVFIFSLNLRISLHLKLFSTTNIFYFDTFESIAF